MIKKIIFLSLLVFTIQFLSAQEVFRKGKTGINIGGGIRTIGVAAYGGNLSLEKSVHRIIRIGYIGVALNGDVLVLSEGDAKGDIIPSATLRAIYHAGFFRTKVLDVYSGVGVAIAKKETPVSYLVHPDFFLGFRSKFSRTSKVAFFAELGYFAANYKVGLSFIL